MKTIYNRIAFSRPFRWVLVVVCGSLWGCGNPMEGFKLTFKEPITEGLYTFTVRDYANQPLGAPRLTIGGAGKEWIVNHLNDAVFRPTDDGRYLVALERSVQPNAQAPVVFTTTFSQEGFVPHTYFFQATSRANRGFTVRLAPAQREEAGVRGGQAQVQPGQTVMLGTSTWRIPADLTWTRTGGGSGGPVEIRTQQFQPSARGFYPGGTLSRVYFPDGTFATDAFQLQQLGGFYQVQVVQDEQEVVGWSRPIEVVLPLAAQTNPTTGQALKAGDNVPWYTYWAGNGRWTAQGQKEVEAAAGGGLQLRVQTLRPELVAVAWYNQVCNTAARFRIQSLLTDLDIQHYAEFRRVSDGRVVRAFHASMNTGTVITANFFPRDTGPVRLYLFGSTDYHGGDRQTPLFVSEAVDPCEAKELNLDVRLAIPFPPSVNIFLSVECPAGTSFQESDLPAQMRVQFSAPGRNQWRELGIFSRSVRRIRSYRVKTGETYDFRLSTDGGVTWPYRQTNYKILASYYGITLLGEALCE
ncbi:MAG: hypothetical protein ACK4LB_14820 [Spirosomataceae bacterium]